MLHLPLLHTPFLSSSRFSLGYPNMGPSHLFKVASYRRLNMIGVRFCAIHVILSYWASALSALTSLYHICLCATSPILRFRYSGFGDDSTAITRFVPSQR